MRVRIGDYVVAPFNGCCWRIYRRTDAPPKEGDRRLMFGGEGFRALEKYPTTLLHAVEIVAELSARDSSANSLDFDGMKAELRRINGELREIAARIEAAAA